MNAIKPVGQGAAARKYDLLTALGAYALAQGKRSERLVLRLITLITARYNWRQDELAVGGREIARLWAVDERTVKREMAKLRAMGWLTVRRQGARGRVTQYRLEIATILDQTRPHWAAVGPDFDLRMTGAEAAPQSVVPFPGLASAPPPDVSDGTEWSLAAAVLHQEDPAVFAAWISALTRQDRSGGRVTLRAPTRFHAAYVQTHLLARMVTVVRSVDPDVSDVVLIC